VKALVRAERISRKGEGKEGSKVQKKLKGGKRLYKEGCWSTNSCISKKERIEDSMMRVKREDVKKSDSARKKTKLEKRIGTNAAS